MRLKAVNRYYNIDKLYSECDEIQRIWRFAALISSWTLLFGFIVLPGLFDEDPRLRFDEKVVVILAVIFLAAGVTLSAVVCCVCRNWLFQSQSVLRPAFSSCTLGFLFILYQLGSSDRFRWNSIAIISLILSALAAVCYGLFDVYTQRKISSINDYPYQPTSRSWHSPRTPKDIAANMFSRRRRREENLAKDEDQTRHQMLQLLHKRESATSPDAASSTFQIQLPDADDDGELSPYGQARANTLLSSAVSPLSGTIPDNTRWDGKAMEAGIHPAHQRTLSREERRHQIEMGS